jgi:hypothetical protein
MVRNMGMSSTRGELSGRVREAAVNASLPHEQGTSALLEAAGALVGGMSSNE